MNRTTRNILITLICFLVYYIASENFGVILQNIDVLFHFRLFSYFITYILIGIPIFIGTYLINNNYDIFNNLGLSKNILRGLILAIIFTLPMFIGGLVFYKFNTDISISKLIAGTIFAGFFEELYFRGFLFGQIFRNTKLGFFPSIIIGALVFASAHLYQSQNISTMTGIFITTFSGAIFFAWLFVEWDYNLWVVVFLHTLMNLSWIIFNISDNALGNINSNIFRGLTIAVAIILTIFYKKKQGQTLSINRNTLLMKKLT
ncbi:MAG: CPBP family intramembrane glutamic endopeptidase [Candidatus Taylorbacteria bacterium]